MKPLIRNLVILVIFCHLLSCGGGGNGNKNNTTNVSTIETDSGTFNVSFNNATISNLDMINTASGPIVNSDNLSMDVFDARTIEDHINKLNLEDNPLKNISLEDFDFFVVIKMQPNCKWVLNTNTVNPRVTINTAYFDVSHDEDTSLSEGGCEIESCDYYFYGISLQD